MLRAVEVKKAEKRERERQEALRLAALEQARLERERQAQIDALRQQGDLEEAKRRADEAIAARAAYEEQVEAERRAAIEQETVFLSKPFVKTSDMAVLVIACNRIEVRYVQMTFARIEADIRTAARLTT